MSNNLIYRVYSSTRLEPCDECIDGTSCTSIYECLDVGIILTRGSRGVVPSSSKKYSLTPPPPSIIPPLLSSLLIRERVPTPTGLLCHYKSITSSLRNLPRNSPKPCNVNCRRLQMMQQPLAGCQLIGSQHLRQRLSLRRSRITS